MFISKNHVRAPPLGDLHSMAQTLCQLCDFLTENPPLRPAAAPPALWEPVGVGGRCRCSQAAGRWGQWTHLGQVEGRQDREAAPRWVTLVGPDFEWGQGEFRDTYKKRWFCSDVTPVTRLCV